MSIIDNFYEGVQSGLRDIEDVYNIKTSYNPLYFGLYLSWYLRDNDLTVRDIPLNNLVGISETEKSSMYSFGFTLDGHKSDDYYHNSDVFYIEFDSTSESYLDDLVYSLSDNLNNKVNENFVNYFILIDNGSDDLVCYNHELVDLLTSFKDEFKNPKNVHIMEYNAIVDYTSSEHKTRCLMHQYTDLSYIAEDMARAVNTCKVTNQDVVFTKDASESLKEKEILFLAYIALKNKLNIIFEDLSFQSRFTNYCKFMFAGKYLPINKFLQQQNMRANSRAVYSGRLNPVNVVVSGFDAKYEIKCLPVESIINRQNVETLGILLEPSIATVDIDRTFEIDAVINTFAPKFLEFNKKLPYGCKDLTTAKISLLEKFQKVAMRVLYDNPVSIKELVFFPHDNKIYFGCISYLDFSLDKYQVAFCTELNDFTTTKVDISDILPTQLFLTDREHETNYSFPTYTVTELEAIWDNMNHEENRVVYYIGQDLLKEAILAQEVLVTTQDRKFYNHCKSIDVEFCKNILINLAGRVEHRLVASP